MITQEDDLAARRAGLEAQAQFRTFMFKFGVMPCVGLAGLGFLMGLVGANDHSGWPGVFFIALGVVFPRGSRLATSECPRTWRRCIC